MEIINCHQTDPFTTKHGSQIRKILEPSNSSIKNQSVAEATLPPGKTTEEHYHPGSEEIYYILSGTGEIKVDNESAAVKPYDGIAILPGKRHQITNTGTTPLVFLCCCAPAYTHEDTIITEPHQET